MYLQWNRHNTLQSGELDSTHNSLDATLAIAYTHILPWYNLFLELVVINTITISHWWLNLSAWSGGIVLFVSVIWSVVVVGIAVVQRVVFIGHCFHPLILLFWLEWWFCRLPQVPPVSSYLCSVFGRHVIRTWSVPSADCCLCPWFPSLLRLDTNDVSRLQRAEIFCAFVVGIFHVCGIPSLLHWCSWGFKMWLMCHNTCPGCTPKKTLRWAAVSLGWSVPVFKDS